MSVKLCHTAIAFTISFLCTLGSAHTMNSDIVSLTLAGVHLRLEERETVCFVKRVDRGGEERAYSLGIPFPCAFHKNRAGDIRTIRSGKYEYALVESAKFVGSGTSECETQLRAIRIAGKQLQISQHKDTVASCPPFQWGRLMYTELFD
jgi:hypothetical protein